MSNRMRNAAAALSALAISGLLMLSTLAIMAAQASSAAGVVA